MVIDKVLFCFIGKLDDLDIPDNVKQGMFHVVEQLETIYASCEERYLNTVVYLHAIEFDNMKKKHWMRDNTCLKAGLL